jgi:hypothetical protein
MKSIMVLLGVGLGSLLVGCSTVPVAFAPVGPNPAGDQTLAATGQLQVFSSLVGRVEGNNPTWYQHSDYAICDLHGKLLKRVDNTAGYYEGAPSKVTLPAGRYLVKAQAQDYPWVKVPVEIESGRITRVHLDDTWLPTVNNAQKAKLVNAPNGYPVGWRVQPSKQFGLN